MKNHSIDGLGRIVIPVSIRKALNIDEKTPLSIFVKDGDIIISPKSAFCKLCGNSIEEISDIPLCKNCIEKVKQAN